MQETLDWVSERIKAVAQAEKDGTFFLYLGRNIGLPVCLEGALEDEGDLLHPVRRVRGRRDEARSDRGTCSTSRRRWCALR